MKKILLFTFLIFVTQFLPAQEPVNHRVRVVDGMDRSLSGVMVEIEGNDLEVFVTDDDGFVELPAKEGDKLKLHKDNQWQKRVNFDQSENVIRLLDNNKLFGTGYDQVTTRENSTAALNGVSAMELEVSRDRNVLNQLHGRIPGLMVMQANTEPWNRSPELLVRGKGSYGGNHTIILIDGIERDVTLIDPGEIESIVVMKDAASLSLYGNRGADGIINLVTKRGGDHGTRVKARYSSTIEQPFRIPEMSDAYRYATALNEALENDQLSPRYNQSDLLTMARGGYSALLPNVNWRDELLRNQAYSNDASLQLDGSSKRARYYVYTSYTSHSGFFNNTNLNEEYSTQVTMHSLKVRSNLETYITPTTVARMNVMGRLMQYQQPTNGLSLEGVYNVPAAAFPVRNEHNQWTSNPMFMNPLADKTAEGYAVTLQRSLFSDITIDQNLSMLLPGLSAQVKLAYDNSADIVDAKTREYAYYQVTPVRDETGSIAGNQYSKYGNDTELAFNSWLGHQMMRTTFWSKLDYQKRSGKHQIDVAGIFGQVHARYMGANNSYMYRDFMMRVGYNYDDRYLIQGVLAYSGSGKMPEGDKYRLYPSLSAAWIVSNEEMLASARDIDFLKVRASFGITGMDRNLSYDMDKQFNGSGLPYIFVGNQIKNGLGEGALPSSLIEPEKEYKSNVGVELRLFKNLVVELDGFYNHRVNIRVPHSTIYSEVLGIGMTDISSGEVRNLGGEISLGWSGKLNNFQYGITSHLTYQKNKIIEIMEEYVPHGYMSRKGQPVDRFYGLIASGLYQKGDFNNDGSLKEGIARPTFIQHPQPGDIKYVDLNNDGMINEYDYTYTLQGELPELYYGTTLQLGYKEWSLFLNFQGVGKSTLSTELESIYWPLYGNNKNISTHYLNNYWSPFTTSAKYPRLTTLPNENNFRRSTLWTERGDFLKLRDVELSYQLPKSVTAAISASECRLFVSGRNLISWDHVKIMDPEQVSMEYPTTRSIALGVNLIF